MWHHPKETPKPGKWILYKTISGSWRTSQKWHTVIKEDYVMGWAYVEDLFAAVNRAEALQRQLDETINVVAGIYDEHVR